MKSKYWFLLVLLFFAFFFAFAYLTQSKELKVSEEDKIYVSNLMNDRNVTYYYSPLCHWCKEQEKQFNFEAIESKINVLEGKSPEITGTPAFLIDGEIIYGFKTNKEMRELLNGT